ncbi:MAG: thioredoxin, partial [Nitrospira sp.]
MGHALKVDEASWDATVMQSPGLVLVDFWAVWCGPCQMIAPIIDELAVEYAGKVTVAKLNTDENPEIAGKYQVMSIPTILIFKNGQPVDRLVGALPKQKFKGVLDSLLASLEVQLPGHETLAGGLQANERLDLRTLVEL